MNIDTFQLEQPDFLDMLKEKLSGFNPGIYSKLEFEILETSIISNSKIVSNIIQKCNDYGINFSLDDFGTGFSSINYLLELPFSYMKIDMHFVRNLLDNPRDIKILKAILDIGKAANIQVIAEGVETEAHEALLIELGCHLGQGFAYSKAIPAKEFEA